MAWNSLKAGLVRGACLTWGIDIRWQSTAFPRCDRRWCCLLAALRGTHECTGGKHLSCDGSFHRRSCSMGSVSRARHIKLHVANQTCSFLLVYGECTQKVYSGYIIPTNRVQDHTFSERNFRIVEKFTP